MNYYLDTCIWRDLYEGRNDNFRPLGEWAFQLVKRIKENNENIIYSEVIIDELLIYYTYEEIKKIFEDSKNDNILFKIVINHQEKQEASVLSKNMNLPFMDCLHAVLAKDNGAILVTRDHHFEELQNYVDIKKPEDLL
ncbi:MAG: type II toxin-antitoxin system VapC family toxin [Candidatus Woesearchaeota archaeon]|jgi:predicted nucleic acid-binding protein